MPLRVLHLLGPLRPSGMERMLASSAHLWREVDVECIVVGQGGDHPYRRHLEDVGYPVLDTAPLRGRSGAKAWRSVVASNRPDVVHVHTESAFGVAVRGARSSGVPVVRTVHSIFPTEGRSSWSRRLQARLVDRHVSAFVAPTHDVARQELAIGRHAYVVANWVDQRFFEAGPTAREPIAVIVGNAAPVKRHEIALAAVRASGVKLAYVGSEAGASPAEVKLLDELAAAGRLVHRGPADPLPWLQRSAVHLLPSRLEGMSVALAEALVVRTPSLICDVPGLSWAASEAGVRVVQPDSEAWARAIRDAVDRPAAAPPPRTELSPQRGVREYRAVYDSAPRAARP